MLCNSMTNQALEDVLLTYNPRELAPQISVMANSSVQTGNGPTTWTLNPFHTPYQRGPHSRAPRVAQQVPQPVSTTRSAPRSPRSTASWSSTTTNAPIVHSVHSTTTAPITSARPTAIQTAGPHRLPRVAATNNAPNAMDSLSITMQPNNQAPRRTGTAISKVHAIAPNFHLTPSIDSMLYCEPSEVVQTNTVPDRIRPKADAIDTTSPMIPIAIENPAKARTVTLYAHSDLLSKRSPTLLSMLKPEKVTESKQQHNKEALKAMGPKSLNIYLNWLYTGNIHAGHRKDESPSPLSPEGYTGLSRLVRCYLVGGRLQDPHFQDATLDAIVTMVCVCRKQGKTMLGLIMQLISQHYAELPVGCKARRLFVHLFAHFGDWRLLEKSGSESFRFETDELIKRGAADDPTVAAAKCMFHEHEVGKCYRQMS